MAQAQKVELYHPIVAASGRRPPLALRIGIPQTDSISEGVPAGGFRAETYVLLSALPEELRRRVELAVQTLITSV